MIDLGKAMLFMYRLPINNNNSLWVLVFFVMILILYMGSSNILVWGDTIANRYMPISIIREFNFDLNEFTFPYNKEVPYFLQYRDGRLISSYPVGAALTATPFYLIPVLLGISHESPWMPLLEKFSAASITLLSAIFLYLALKRLTTMRTSLVVTAVYALCTSALSISSQALWQHGPSQFFLALGLYCLIRGLCEENFLAWAGFPLGASIVCRPTDALMVLPILAYICLYKRTLLLRWILCFLPPALFLISYNYLHFGSIFESGYGTGVLQPSSSHWSGPFLYGFLGILLSPSKGLFIYSPILLLSFVGIYLVWRKKRDPLLRFISLGPVLVIILYSKWHFWWGGETYGPRLVADITPFLCLYLYPVWDSVQQQRLLKSSFLSLAMISLLMHAVGAFSFDASWYQKTALSVDSDRLWSLQDSPFVHYGQRLLLRNFSYMRTALSSQPTSAQAPHQLSASLVHQGLPSYHRAGEPIRLFTVVTNTGPTIWLFQTNDGRYGVRLGWRWVGPKGEVLYDERRMAMVRDIFPGEQERIALEIWPPSAEGQYVLELGMVSEPAAWFAVDRFTVQVVGSCHFEEVLNRELKFIHERPSIKIAPDKPFYRFGEIGKIRISITNGDIARNLRLSVLLRHPDGHMRSLSSSMDLSTNPPCNQWIHMAPPHILSRNFKIDWDLSLQSKNMSVGYYTLYAFMTEPSSTEIVAKSIAMFYISEIHLNNSLQRLEGLSF